jgi:hypothetical protein
MTLSERNRCFRIGIFISLVFLLLVIGLAWFVLPACPAAAAAASRRYPGFLTLLIGKFLPKSPYPPFISIGGAALFSFISTLMIYRFFEKTQSSEILFIAFFALSFSVESMRLTTPLKTVYETPGLYLLMASRLLIFGRYAGLFSLFAAGVHAAGLKVQKQRYVIFVIIVAALIIALGVPIDTLSWDSSFSMVSGYTYTFHVVETGVFLITIASFLIAAYSRGDRAFAYIGLGAFLAFTGRVFLLGADTWPGPFAGLALLGTGLWFMCTKLHTVYLWL